MPDTVANLPLPTDGGAVVLPPVDARRYEDRILLRGAFTCFGESFDARYLADGGTVHNYLKWSPVTPELVREDPQNHVYEYRVAPGALPTGQSLTVRLDVDRLIDKYIGQTRSEIVNSLSGSVEAEIQRTPVGAPFPWGTVLGASLTGTVAVGGFLWVARRRQLLAGITPDLMERINRIQNKAVAARQAVGRQDGTLPLRQRIETLAGAALPLARQVADLRKARTITDRSALVRAVSLVEERLPEMPSDSPQRREAEAMLEEKKKAITRWDELEKTESLCLLRLEKIEAILDSTALTLHSAQAHSTGPASEEGLRKALDAEVAAVHAVAQETPELQLTIGRR